MFPGYRPRPPQPDHPVDNSRVVDATGRLLASAEWQQRVVEKVRPLSADHYELRRSFQYEIPRNLVADLVGIEGELDVFLPVCWLPKYALLEFDIRSGEGEPLILLERRSAAGVLANLLEAWRLQVAALESLDFDARLVESVCSASLTPWSVYRQRSQSRGASDVDATAAYLSALLSFPVAALDVGDALDNGRALASEIYHQVGRDHDYRDRDNAFVVAPLLAPYVDPEILDRPALGEFFEDHSRRVRSVADAARSSDEAYDWCALLAELGIRWPVLVKTRVTVEQPFLVKVREIRESGDRHHPRVFKHRSDLGAARSYHLHVSAPDPSVKIAGEPVATRSDGEQVGADNVFENAELTDQLFVMYTSFDDRPDWVDVHIEFGLRPSSLLGYLYAILLVGGAIVAALGAGVDTGRAALFTIPTTLVSAYLIVGDPPLVARFLRFWRSALILASLSLWVIVLWKVSGCPWEGIAVLSC